MSAGRREINKMELKLHLGALAPKLDEQLTKQGLQCKDIEIEQKAHESMLMLWFHGYVNDSQKEKMTKKLFNNIKKKARPIVSRKEGKG